MIRTHILSSVLLAAGVFATVACAAEPGSSMYETKFQRLAATFQKYDVHGQPMYCKKGEPATFSQLPGYQCFTEPQLRELARTDERWRNQMVYNHNMTKGG